MGLFSSSTRTQVGTSVSRMVQDSALPDSIITGSIMAIQQSDGQMIEHAMEELSSGLALRVHQFYEYAATKYVNGLPSGTTMTNLLGKETVIAAIEAQLQTDIGLDYYHVGPLNLMHVGWHLLVRDYAYDSRDNSLMVGGRKVYLTDMQPVVMEATTYEVERSTLDLWGVPPTAGVTPNRKYPGIAVASDRPVFIVDPAIGTDKIKAQYCYEEAYTKVVDGVNVPATRVIEGIIMMAITDFDMTATYHQAGYRVNDRTGFWLYRLGERTNPAVDAIFDTVHDTEGTFFPMIYFRLNKQTISDTDPAFASSKKLLKILNMAFEDTVEAINENPDIGDVEQAIMTFAVPADTKNPVEQKYLFDFFNNLWTASEEDAKSHSEFAWDHSGIFVKPSQQSAIIIQDKKFKMALSWKTIIKRRVSGTVAKVGGFDSHETEKDETTVAVTVLGMTVTVPTATPKHAYRRQVSENVYEEVEVVGLKMTYYVYNEYTTTGDENNDNLLLIPLDFAITKHYTMKDRELLYARSMHYVFNSRVVTKLKWYETGIFKVFLIVIAIVVTIITKGLTWQAVVAAFSTVAAIEAALIAILVWYLKFKLISLILRKVVSAIGLKAAFIIAVIAAAAGMYQLVTTEGGLANAPWAKELLTLSSGLTGGMQAEIKNEFNDLTNEYRTFEEFAKDKTEKLDMVNAVLDGKVHLVPLIIWGEAPNDFYQRTVHSGNIGVVGIDAVSSFVDVALSLPKLTDTLGDLYV